MTLAVIGLVELRWSTAAVTADQRAAAERACRYLENNTRVVR
ncbi:hypothetical protein [Streptomyces anulatus]